MQADLYNFAAASLELTDDDHFRISIAGAEEKIAYMRVADHWARPRGTTPTSHIFKTSMGIPPGPDETDMRNSVERAFLRDACPRGQVRLAPPHGIISVSPVIAAERSQRKTLSPCHVHRQALRHQ